MADKTPLTSIPNEGRSTPILSSKVYDKMKFLAQIGLPAIGTLYFTLAALWGLPKSEEVVGSIMAVDVCLGVLLGLSTRQYNNSDASSDGFLTATGVDPDTGHPNLQMIITKPPTELLSGKTVTLKVGDSTQNQGPV